MRSVKNGLNTTGSVRRQGDLKVEILVFTGLLFCAKMQDAFAALTMFVRR